MIFKNCLLVKVSDEKSGVSQQTGKEWKMKSIIFMQEHTDTNGKTWTDSIVGDYFGDKSVADLRAFIGTQTRFDVDCWMNTELYNGRDYQRCRIQNINQVL